jgi:hypothetical protein
MNWLRDNILKIAIILGAVILAIIIFAIIATPKGEQTVSGSKYAELETKLQNAAIKYVSKNKKKLPKSMEEVTKISLKSLQSNKYIGNLVAVDDSSVSCTGYVEVTKLDEELENYRYTPFISCGKYYTTKTIGDYIISLETKDETFNRTEGAGLYKIGTEYVFRGEAVNNFVSLENHLYRVISIDENSSLQLISVQKTNETYVWDDRYNIEKKYDYGINDFDKSRLHEALDKIYNPTNSKTDEVFFGEKEKAYIVEHDFCTGKRSLNDGGIYSGAECKTKTKLKVGLITLSEYARASIDTNCTSVFDRSCANYNFFNSLGSAYDYNYFTLTGVEDNTYEFYRINNEELVYTKTSNSSQLYPVIYLNYRTIFTSGTGTQTDPYVVR